MLMQIEVTQKRFPIRPDLSYPRCVGLGLAPYWQWLIFRPKPVLIFRLMPVLAYATHPAKRLTSTPPYALLCVGLRCECMVLKRHRLSVMRQCRFFQPAFPSVTIKVT